MDKHQKSKVRNDTASASAALAAAANGHGHGDDLLDRTQHARNKSFASGQQQQLQQQPPAPLLQHSATGTSTSNDEEEEDEVPRIISYPGVSIKDIRQISSGSGRKTFTSDLSGDAIGEEEALLPNTNGTSNGRPSPIIEQSNSYGGTDENDETKPTLSTYNSPSHPRRPRRSSRRESDNLSLMSSFNSNGSILHNSLRNGLASIRSASQRHNSHGRTRLDSIVQASDGTPLLGSSKLAANALSVELRRSIASAGTNGGNREWGISWADENGLDDESTIMSVRTARTLQEIEEEYLEKTRTTFYNDAMTFAEGTIPQSIVLAFCIGCVCGLVAYMYYTVLDYLLNLIWKEIPEWIIANNWMEHTHVLWIPLVTFTLSGLCGLSIYYLGEPGDLAYTIKCIHEKGYKGTHHIIPMIAASQFTILAGASLGPEAPLVAICAATAGFLSRKVFKQTNRNVVRKHTFMGMAGALSAFFGVPLGGSLFALEVTSRFGVEYFEHLMETILAGEICVCVFRTLAGLPLGQIWKITPDELKQTEPYMIIVGAGIGLLGAGVATFWANIHWRLMAFFKSLGLLDDENIYAVPRVMLGATGVVIIGMLVPQTMFWGEFEFGILATLSPASRLPHVWPTAGLIGFEMDSCVSCLIVGFCKLLAISFTVAGGYRGGYIFPFFAAGAAFGRALCFAFPTLNPSIATLCFAAGINVAITRTALATSLILSYLSGEQFALPAVLSASLVSLFATGYVPFIKTQLTRSDIDFSLYHRQRKSPKIPDSIRKTDAQRLQALSLCSEA